MGSAKNTSPNAEKNKAPITMFLSCRDDGDEEREHQAQANKVIIGSAL